MTKTVAIIPARGGSKRLYPKNRMPMGGIPLIAHSILYARANAQIIDIIYVSTNCPITKQIALDYGAKVIDRPESLSGDLEPTVSAMKHVLENIDTVENVILLQPTNPLRPKNLLAETMAVYENGNHDSLFTVTRNRQKFGKINNQKFIPYNYTIGQRSQDLEPLFFENGLVYITKASLILENCIISENAFPFEVDHVFAKIDIDTQEDFDYAEFLYHQLLTKKS